MQQQEILFRRWCYHSLLRENCPYSEFFWSVFCDTEYLSEFSPNAGKYSPEKLRIGTLLTQWLPFQFKMQFQLIPHLSL